MKTHKINPFVIKIVKDLKVKHKAIGGVRNDKDGEAIIRLDRRVIDTKIFNKLYKSHISIFDNLSKPGTKVFTFILEYCIKVDKDYFYYSKKDCMFVKDLNVRSAEKGLKELIDKEIIARSTMHSMFWLNIGAVFNGDRTKVLDRTLKELASNNE